MVADARAGIVVAPEDSSALAAAIRNICANPAQASEMGRNGRAFVEENFAWSALVRDWLEQVCAFAQAGVAIESQRSRAAELAAGRR